MLSIIVEVNIYLNGSREVAGLFFEDKDGDIWLGHTGNIRKYKDEFWDWFRQKSVGAYDSNGKNHKNVVPIGKLKNSNFSYKLAQFVNDMVKIKQKGVVIKNLNKKM